MDQAALLSMLTKSTEDPAAFSAAAAELERASDGGDGYATCLLATVEAVGAGRPQNWNRAFDLLLKSAELGHDHAQRQLQLLARRAGEGDWQALRGAIDLEALLAAPERESLSDAPRIRIARGFATPEECHWIIEATRPKLQPATVWSESQGYERRADIRSNSTAELGLFDLDVVIQVVRARISTITKLPVQVFEVPQILHYAVGESVEAHFDFLDPEEPGFQANLSECGQRIATFLLYLSEKFEGGETHFPDIGLAYRGQTGDAIFFANVDVAGAPDPKTRHGGLAPTSGEKWLLSQWIRDRTPVRA